MSRAQARDAGLSARQIDRLVATREWLVALPGVYRLHASAPLPETGMWAASLWLGPTMVLADEGAAWWWGVLPDPPTTWAFIGPSRRRARPGVTLLDTRVDPADRWRHRGVPVLSRSWAVLRAAARREELQTGSGIAVIDRAKQLRLVKQDDLGRAYERHRGCWGSTTMRQLLARTGDGAHSELERLAVSELYELTERFFDC